MTAGEPLLTGVDAICKPHGENPVDADAPGFGLYIHWPFCKAKCPYCDFNSHVRSHIDQARWRRALLAELRYGADRWPSGRPLTSIFFGGGTPSLMPPASVAALVDEASRLFDFAPDIEITLEANPTSVEASNFAGFAKAGVNRVSLGIQSLDDRALRFLGREHNASEAKGAIEIARTHFKRTSFDLIYARAGQTEASWCAELEQALQWAGDHISLYQLTIEPGTRFHAEFQAGRLPVMQDDAQARLFEMTTERLAMAGFEWYEISNFARPGQSSRHNLVYWRYGDYLGIGPGAHGRLGEGLERLAISTRRAPDTWLAAVEASGHGIQEETPIRPREAVIEALMMGLRLAEGVPWQRLEMLGGGAWRAAINESALQRLTKAGWLTCDSTRITATAAGRLLLDSLLADLVEP